MNKPILLILAAFQMCFACSAFLLKSNGGYVVGKNYDWRIENGRILINKSGVSKKALAAQNPASWQSKYGSVTFNQYGQEFPIGGINEKGLVIEALWLDETNYPLLSENIPRIDNMQWIQFQLDISANVDEVISNDKSVQINPVSATAVHYFVADKSGKTVIIESVGGIVHRYLPDTINPPLLTNDPYDKSIRLMQKCVVFGGNLEVPKGQGSISRFIRTAIHIREGNTADSDNPISTSFKILNDVKMTLLTKWSIVYDLNNSVVYFKTASGNNLKSIELIKLNFKCTEPVQYVNIKTNNKGSISDRFKEYSFRDNYDLIKKSVEKTDFLRSSGKRLIKLLSDYKASINCMPQ
jgi:penicillin V acylase-like amidase (Ntn superfamily)